MTNSIEPGLRLYARHHGDGEIVVTDPAVIPVGACLCAADACQLGEELLRAANEAEDLNG